jgi:hypothetical protein
MKRHAWFYRYSLWNGMPYYWPCHWIGVLVMLAAIALALISGLMIVDLSRAAGHPMLGGISFITVGAVYVGFDRIADGHARD